MDMEARTFYVGATTARDFPHAGGSRPRTSTGGPGPWPSPCPPLEALRVGSSAAEQGMLFIFSWLGGPGNSSSFPVREGLLNSEFNLS